MKICMSEQQLKDKLTKAFKMGTACNPDKGGYMLNGLLEEEFNKGKFTENIINTDRGLIYVIPEKEEEK